MHTPVPVGPWHLQKLDARRNACARRPTSIARRDAHRNHARPVSGLSSWSDWHSRRIAFPHPSKVQWLCDPPDLDYRCGGSAGFGRIRTGLPVYPSPAHAVTAFGRLRWNGHLTPREACLPRGCAVKGRLLRCAPWHDQTVGIANDSAARAGGMTEWAGYLAVAPLLLCLAGVGLLPSYALRELAQRIALAWGAVLLAGVGALHLGLALAGGLPRERARGSSVLPALIAAAALVLTGERGLALLVVGHGGWWLYEHRVLHAQLPPAYLALRRQLTLATCMLLALTMFVSDAAGLE